MSARGRSQAGEKTMLDVLVPVLETLKTEAGRADLIERVRATAERSRGAHRADAGDQGPRLVSRSRAASATSIRREVELRSSPQAVCSTLEGAA